MEGVGVDQRAANAAIEPLVDRKLLSSSARPSSGRLAPGASYSPSSTRTPTVWLRIRSHSILAYSEPPRQQIPLPAVSFLEESCVKMPDCYVLALKTVININNLSSRDHLLLAAWPPSHSHRTVVFETTLP